MFGSLSEIRMVYSMSSHSNILCAFADKPHNTESANQFKCDIQLVYIIPSKLTINIYYEHK